MVFVFNADGTYANTMTNPFNTERVTENGTSATESHIGNTIRAQLTEPNGHITIAFTMLDATHMRMARNEPISFVLVKG
jgi:hypothetical protein